MSDLSEKAELLVEIHRQMIPLKERESVLKNALTTHYEGETVTLKDGSTVQITKSSQPVRKGTEARFDEDRYWKLPADLRAQLEKMKVVTMQASFTRGASASVRVTVK